jgi:hypothetical protein
MGKKNTPKWAGSFFNHFNLKGKKTKRLCCGCCTMFNFKDHHREKEAQKYIAEEIINNDFRD